MENNKHFLFSNYTTLFKKVKIKGWFYGKIVTNRI